MDQIGENSDHATNMESETTNLTVPTAMDVESVDPTISTEMEAEATNSTTPTETPKENKEDMSVMEIEQVKEPETTSGESLESVETPPDKEPSENPTADSTNVDESDHKEVSDDSEKKEVNNESDNKEINDETDNKEIINESDNKEVNDESDNKEVNDESERNELNDESEEKDMNEESNSNETDPKEINEEVNGIISDKSKDSEPSPLSQQTTPDENSIESVGLESDEKPSDESPEEHMELDAPTQDGEGDSESFSPDENQISTNGTLEDGDQEQPIFEHVNTEKDNSKDSGCNDQSNNDEDFPEQPQEDPIAADGACGIQFQEPDEEKENIEGNNEEICIIPDAERVIPQNVSEVTGDLVERDGEEIDGTGNGADAVLGIDQFKDSALVPVEEKFVISKCTDETLHSCVQCLLPRKCKYISSTELRTLYICEDPCLTTYKEENQGKVVCPTSGGDLRVKNLPTEKSSITAVVNFIRKCSTCQKQIESEEGHLSWETMDFCNEICLSKYQRKIGSNCSNCSVEVRPNCLGKYCVRFGYDIRQFCSSSCLEEYKKGLKVCSYCQKDISGGSDSFLAPIGDKGQFKDFCTRECMEKYDIMSNHAKPVVKPGVLCSVCSNEKPITIEYEHNEKKNLFCGEPCFVAFKFVEDIAPGKCDMCRKFYDNKLLEEFTMVYDDEQHSFCSKSCQNIYIIANRRIVPCSWCKVKKYNFDMIRRSSPTGQIVMMCSLNCLSLYQVSLNAVNSKKTKCDNCNKSLQPMYHLTMSDASIHSFCSYGCVMNFQIQYTKSPITLTNDNENGDSTSRKSSSETELLTMPVISSVQSLAPTTNGSSTRKTKPTINSISQTSTGQPVKMQIKQQVIVKPSPLPPQRNVATMCKVAHSNKSVSMRPTMISKEVQTEQEPSKTMLVPVPVPIYVPAPLPMYSLPLPVPVPFPLPIPVPIFIPTTRNSAAGIIKEIKKIQVKIPTDPFEAELLMMAEMVADDKKEDHTDSESDEDETHGADEPGTFSPEPVDAANTFGDDMLQMALKMATELDEPAVDLEGALTANTITAAQSTDPSPGTSEDPLAAEESGAIMERQNVRGRKRSMRGSRGGGASKRGRRMSTNVDVPMMAPPQPPPPPEPMEKPDANMCLKYTFGVNAWKQWVTTKNAELEKSSRKVKLFKPEILQLTADELNYSLCLFVKEVRKPNGTEYAPDTIYYLCLGIQQYLFENGRIDNIFCDAYYEKFTDCLDEVARKFSVLYNDSHYIVTRVEEEHLWESKQLGAHSPHVLLSTLMFFNTKHFNLTTVDEHMQLSFSHIMKHWKRNPNQPGTAKTPGSRNVLLRFYPPQSALSNVRKKKVYEQQENEENPLRCPVKLYEFYLSKCPESVKTRNDVFYLQPERSCVPDSPVWYSTMPLAREALEKMLHRVKMVKEINVALLTS